MSYQLINVNVRKQSLEQGALKSLNNGCVYNGVHYNAGFSHRPQRPRYDEVRVI